MCDWNLRFYGLYRISESSVYGLRSRHILQYNHQRSRVYSLYGLRCRHLSNDSLYDDGKSRLYYLRSRIDL